MENRDFANDRFTSSEGVHSKNRMWNSQAEVLNSSGGASKTGEQWHKYWQDQRREVKKRAADIRCEIRITGGGPATVKPLSTMEENILNIITPQAAHGNEVVPEGGLEDFPLIDASTVFDAENNVAQNPQSSANNEVIQETPEETFTELRAAASTNSIKCRMYQLNENLCLYF